jgi:DNA modification methylase
MKATYHLDTPSTDILVADCRTVLPALSAEGIDLIFADPPFNQGEPYGVWKDALSPEGYRRFTYQWLDACIGVLAPHGSLWVNVPDHIAAEIVVHLKSRNLHLINWCVWHYRFGVWRDTNFIGSKVHVLYFAKDLRFRRWNPQAIRVPSDRATKYNDARTRQTQTPGLRVPFDVWGGEGEPYWGRVQGNNKERCPDHPNQLPEVYLERVIRATSNEGDLVLDPFLGSGTTCTVARALGRRSIGIEISPDFARSAFQRVQRGPVHLGLNQPTAVIGDQKGRGPARELPRGLGVAMIAAQLFTSLARQGFTLAAEGDGIRVRPRSRLTDAIRQDIREHKTELLALLADRELWDQSEADRLIASVLAGWDDPDRPRELHQLAETIDAAFLSRSLAALRACVATFRAVVAAQRPTAWS